MTSNEFNDELQQELSEHDPNADVLERQLTSHKVRRNASIDAGAAVINMRVQRARSAASTGRVLRPVTVRFAYAVSAAAAALLLFVTFNPNDTEQGGHGDSLSLGLPSALRVDKDVDALADDLLRRNGNGSATWTVTDADVDRLLGDADIEL